MPGYEGDGVGWWVIFPIIFMVFMMVVMFRMMGRGGPMGMMGGMGGGHRHGADDEDASRRSQGRSVESRETPLAVAQRRYASGEISREEFQRIRDDLG
jgi:putative membrane protein